MLAMKLDFSPELTQKERDIRADPRIYECNKQYPLSRLAKMYGMEFHKFLTLVLRFRGYDV